MIPAIALVSFLLEVVYPLWATYQTLYKPQTTKEESEVLRTKWTVYWVMYTLCSWVHSGFLHYITDYLPLFQEMKCVALFWLTSNDFNGVLYVWETHLRSAFLKCDDFVTQFREARMQGLMDFALESPSAVAGRNNAAAAKRYATPPTDTAEAAVAPDN